MDTRFRGAMSNFPRQPPETNSRSEQGGEACSPVGPDGWVRGGA